MNFQACPGTSWLQYFGAMEFQVEAAQLINEGGVHCVPVVFARPLQGGRPVELGPRAYLNEMPVLRLDGAAWNTPWREFSHNLVSITSLAVGLVAFTVAGVAAVAGWIAPGFDWRIGFVLGAVVSPTDAIAATSIARNMGLPRRIVDVL